MKSHPSSTPLKMIVEPSRLALAALSALILVLLAGCPNSDPVAEAECDVTDMLFSPKEGEPIATIGGQTALTVDDLRARIAQQSPFMRPRMETPEGRRGLVEQLVQFELLAIEAARQDIHLEPEVQQAIKRAMVSHLVAKRMEQIEESGEVSEERLKEFYEENISEFVQPERIRVSHVFFSATGESGEDRAGARERANLKLASLRSSPADDAGTFSRLAREHSDDIRSRSVGGDLRYQTKEQLSEEWGIGMADAAFELERVGSISEIVEGEKGFHLIRLVGRQRAVDRKLEDVRPLIINRVQREDRNRNFETFVAQIGEREGLKIDEELLERMDQSSEQGTPEGATSPSDEGGEN